MESLNGILLVTGNRDLGFKMGEWNGSHERE